MENRKINLDRPRIDSNEIQSHKNFDQVLSNYQVMSKPFYKSNWFFGTTGLASLGLIIGGTFAFQDPEPVHNDLANLPTDAPPEFVVPDNSLISMNVNHNDLSRDLIQETLNANNQNENLHEETLPINIEEINHEQDELVTAELVDEESIETEALPEEKSFSMFDLNPRISGKVNGTISKEELFDNKGITTESDVSIIHFELHLIDGLGGKTFVEEGNQLNEEMKKAIKNLGQGDEIYFEEIKGQTDDGTVVRLNPLRYVLMN